MSRNVELKARLADLDPARQTAGRLGARLATTVSQTDTYFVVPDGRLKLRESRPGEAELIFYRRPDTKTEKVSEYSRVPVSDPAAIGAMLGAALGVGTRVRKVREVWLLDNVRIHLDRVEGLGTFLEFEAIVGPNHAEPACVVQAARLAEAFGLDDSSLIAASYADLPVPSGGRSLRLTQS